jgi:enamine deaminase RidA (YjgF/YER057c/UK114 family)
LADLALLEHPTAGSYAPLVRNGDLVFVSGHIGWRDGKASVVGVLGAELTVDQGKIAARDAALAALGILDRELGGLDKIESVVRMFGMVRADPRFGQHPAVIDWAAEVLLELLGDRGVHARSAVGMTSLPFGAAVELELVGAGCKLTGSWACRDSRSIRPSLSRGRTSRSCPRSKTAA